MRHARGTFDIKMTPIPAEPEQSSGFGRMRIAKTFHGDIIGTGNGEMLATMNEQHSGAYVAMERIDATINGRIGAFSLVHRGMMDEGAHDLSIAIVPGSGSGELEGISGVFHLTIEAGVHHYDLEYNLSDPMA